MLSNLNILSDDLKRLEYLKLKLIDMGVSGAFSKSNETHGTGTEVIRKSYEISGRNQSFRDETYKPYINIPKNWDWATTEELCFTQTGTTPEKGPVPAGMESITYITSADLNEFAAHSTTKVLRYPKSKTLRVAPAGSVLFVGIGNIGKCGVTTEEVTFNQQIHAATPYVMNPKYLCYFYSSSYFRNQFSAISSATTLTILNKSKWSGIHIPVPTLGEQERIVDQIESLLAICSQIGEAINFRDTVGEAARKSAVDAISTAQTHEDFRMAWERIKSNWGVFVDSNEGIALMRKLVLSLGLSGELLDKLQAFDFSEMAVLGGGKKPIMLTEVSKVRNSRGDEFVTTSISSITEVISQSLSKIKSSAIQSMGQYPVVDQGKAFVSGYVDGVEPVRIHGRPVVIFGDHTRNIKYIDFDFVVGADGVRILRPYFLNPKFLYYMAQAVDVKSRGYGRHFREFCNSRIPVISIEDQDKTVRIIEEIFEICEKLENEILQRESLAERITKSVVHNSG